MNLIVVGLPATGKSSTRHFLEDKGWDGYEASSFASKMLREFNVDTASELLAIGGKDVIAKRISSEILHSTINQHFVVSGFRLMSEIEYFQKMHSVKVIMLSADFPLRFQRSLNRRRLGEVHTLEEFTLRNLCDLNLGLREVFNSSIDLKIDASRPFASVSQEILDYISII